MFTGKKFVSVWLVAVMTASVQPAPQAQQQTGAQPQPSAGPPQPGVIAGDPAKGAALLGEARTALGGADKLAAIKTLQVKGDFQRNAGNTRIDGVLEIFVEAPDKMKRVEDTSMPGGGPAIISTQVLNGTEVWDENTGGLAGLGRGGFGGGGRGGGGGGRGGGGVRPGGGAARGDAGAAAPAAPAAAAGGARGTIDPERIREALVRQRQADLARFMFAWLLRADAPVTWIGTAQSPDGTADVLEFRPTDGTPATRMFLDSTTHMPLLITWQAGGAGGQGGARRGGGAGGDGERAGGGGRGQQGGQQGQPTGEQRGQQPGGEQAGGEQGRGQRGGGAGAPQQATQRMTLANYKTVNGIKLPHTITRGVNGQTNEEWSIDSYKLNQTFRSNTFEQR